MLSDAFAHLKVRGAIFLTGLYTEKWAYRVDPHRGPRGDAHSRTQDRVILFHVVASGRCWIATEGGEKHWASAGDVIVLPYGDSHRMGGTEDTTVLAAATNLDHRTAALGTDAGHPSTARVATATQVMCGYMTL